MADLLSAALAWLGEQRVAFMSHAVTYKRGTLTCEVQATTGRTLFTLQNDAGVFETFESRDFLFSTAELVLDGEAALPQRGDEIRETQGTKVFVCTVLAPQGEQAFKYSDPYRRTLRVHTKVTGVEEA